MHTLKKLILCALVASLACGADLAPPAENQGYWTAHTAEPSPGSTPGTGVPGGFLRFTAGQSEDRAETGSVINVVTAHSADNTGATDATSAIQAAINAASAGDVVYLPAGTYLIAGTLSAGETRDEITVRGAGSVRGSPSSTVLKAGGGANQDIIASFGVGNSFRGSAKQAISGTVTKGATTLSVVNASLFTANQPAVIYVSDETDNARITAGAAPTFSSGGFTEQRQWTVMITGRDTVTNTVTIDPPLLIDLTDYPSTISPGQLAHQTLKYFGVEDLRVVNGDDITISSASRSSAVVTVNTATNHGFSTGDYQSIFGLTGSLSPNGNRQITVVDADTFTFTLLSGSGSETYTGAGRVAHSYYKGIILGRGIYCWVYNVEFEYQEPSAAGTPLQITAGFRNEVQKNTFIARIPSSSFSDGGIQYSDQTSALIWDNAFLSDAASNSFGWDVGIYSDGYVVNSVHAFNFDEQGNKLFLINHTAGHAVMNLYEGNFAQRMQSDGYFSSTSHHTVYRNWFSGRNASNEAHPSGGYASWFKRFTRNLFLAGNVWGWDGTDASTKPQYGYPNYNDDSTGTPVQPTGGTFWQDWNLTGTLTTRTSDTDAVVTAAGQWSATSGGSGRQITLYWDGGSRYYSSISSRSGNDLTLVGGSGTVLPDEDTIFTKIAVGVAGFQEIDLDVEDSFTIIHNYESSPTTGAVTDATADTLPRSLFMATKPDWFGSLEMGANPDAPDFDYTLVPAGYRAINGTEDYLGPSAPTFSTNPATQTATVGDDVTLTVAGGGNPSPTLQWRKGGVNISGETSSSLVLSNVQLSDAGSYDCVATNTEGTATSTTGVLTVNAATSGGESATNTFNVKGAFNLQ